MTPIKKKWIFVDPNYLPARSIDSNEKIVKKILKAFSPPGGNKNITFSTEAFVAGAQAEKAKASVAAWRSKPEMMAMHAVTPEKAVHNERSWLDFALLMGETEVVKAILSLKSKDGLAPLIPVDTVLPSNGTPLQRAVIYGHQEIVEFLLDHGADVNRSETDGSTALNMAAARGRLELARLLLDRGAMPHPSNFYFAAKYGHLSLVQELIDRGATFGIYGGVSLSFAAKNGHVKVVQYLLDHGVDTHTNIPANQHPLLLAVQNGHEAVAALLLDRGEAANLVSDEGEPLLHIAAMKGYPAMVASLLNYNQIDPNQKDPQGDAPLHLAAKNGHTDVVRILLSHPATDLVSVNHKNDTPLEVAAQNGQVEVVKLLMGRGLSPDEKALRAAAKRGHLPMVSLLMEAGVVPNERTLVEATHANNPALLRALLTYPIDINQGIAKFDNANALHNAAGNGRLEAVKYLLDAGANLDQTTTDHLSALYFAAERGKVDVVEELLNRGAKINPHFVERNESLLKLLERGANLNPTLIHDTIDRGDIDTLRLLLRLPGNAINHPDKAGNSPLHIAARAGNNKMVSCLVAAGADPNLQDKWGYTPLHIAIEINDPDMVSNLLALHPDVNLQTGNEAVRDETVLHLAIKEDNPLPVIAVLLQKGADPTIKNQSGKTPIDVAIDKGRYEVAVTLLYMMDELSKDMLARLQASRGELLKVLVRDLKSIETGQALEMLDSILIGDNALGQLLKTKPAAAVSRWSFMSREKTKPSEEIEILKALHRQLVKEAPVKSPRHT